MVSSKPESSVLVVVARRKMAGGVVWQAVIWVRKMRDKALSRNQRMVLGI